MNTWLRRGALAAIVLALAVQLVPYGRGHDDPPVSKEPAWDSPRTRELAVRACFDCHSRETNWPWYSHVAPISWLVQHDVDEGRHALDFSAWDEPQDEAHESAEVVQDGEMPPWFYTPLHSDARLTDGELEELIRGLSVTFGGERDSREDRED